MQAIKAVAERLILCLNDLFPSNGWKRAPA